MDNLFTFTTNLKRGVVWKKPSETLTKILEKYLRKSLFFVKVAVSKEEFIHLKDFTKSLSSFEFWEECFH